MGREEFELRDGRSTEQLMSGEGKKGCFISLVAGFILLLLAIAIAVGVAVVVYFAAVKNDIKCSVEPVSAHLSARLAPN